MTPPAISEAAFQNSVIQLAHVFGWTVAHFRTVRIQRRNGSVYYETPVQADGKGYPDLHLVRGPRSVFAEIKRDHRSQASAEQLAWLDALRAAGHDAFVWRPSDWDEIERVLR